MIQTSSKTFRTLTRALFAAALIGTCGAPSAHAREMTDYPVVKLQSLEKTTARTRTFEANVGSTVKFGSLFIKVQACRKASPIDQPESAAFMQIWEMDKEDKPQWVFSGWMFASSPGLSSMDHPIYDVWVLDCQEQKGAVSADIKKDEEKRGEGELDEQAVPVQPDEAPAEQMQDD